MRSASWPTRRRYFEATLSSRRWWTRLWNSAVFTTFTRHSGRLSSWFYMRKSAVKSTQRELKKKRRSSRTWTIFTIMSRRSLTPSSSPPHSVLECCVRFSTICVRVQQNTFQPTKRWVILLRQSPASIINLNLFQVRYSVVSGFIFLRFFAPAILGPKLFDLTAEPLVSVASLVPFVLTGCGQCLKFWELIAMLLLKHISPWMNKPRTIEKVNQLKTKNISFRFANVKFICQSKTVWIFQWAKTN